MVKRTGSQLSGSSLDRITVANRTETAARVKYAFDHNKILIDELCDPENTVHIDSKVFESIEEEELQTEPTVTIGVDSEESEDDEAPTERKKTRKELALELREIVNTVGKPGRPGAQVKNVVSVGMLTEGWDARTVTHIMGLRAFTSQLLCEQVVGRGLRRTSYEVNPETGLFEPEYVNIFGVPFTFLPHEEDDSGKDGKEKPKFIIQPISEKSEYEITFPNVLRVEHVFKPTLSLEMKEIPVLVLDAYETPTLAQMAPIVDGKADFARMSEINLNELGQKFRLQKIAFEAARDIYEQVNPSWKGNKEYLLGQLISLVEKYLNSGRIQFKPPLFYQDEFKQRILIALNMGKVVQHIWEAIRFKNSESLDIVLDESRPIRSTSDMSTWYTSKPSEFTKKSHINRAVFDSSWEATEAYELDRNENVVSWVKNDHLGFLIYYVYQGISHAYYPDFIIKLINGTTLVLEVKGVDDQRNHTKREFLDEWVRAVNAHGGFGQWTWAVSKNPADLPAILSQ
jgi:type III restriction enzyme